MTKKNISSKKLRIISFIVSGFVLILVNTLLSEFAMKKIYALTEAKFMDSYALNAAGYTESIEKILDNYKSILNAYDSDIFKNGSDSEIQQYLVRTASKTPPTYSSVFFATAGGTFFMNSGRSFKTEKRELHKNLMKSKSEISVAGPFTSDVLDETFIVFVKVIYGDDEDVPKGFLGTTMRLDVLYNILSSVRIGEHSSFTILNSKGVVIYMPDKSRLNTVSDDSDAEIMVQRFNAFNTVESGISKLKDRERLVFYNLIKDTDWYLGLSVPESEHREIYSTHYFYQTLITIFSIFSVVLVLFLEMGVTEFLRKRDLILFVNDPLTNLFTWNHFEEDGEKMLRRGKKDKFMLIETDIHGFKFLNQNFGTEAADNVLIFYSQLLAGVAEKNKGILCRSYADHFCMLFKISSVHAAMAEFKDAVEKIDKKIQDYEIRFNPKFGIAFFIPGEEKLKTKENSPDKIATSKIGKKNNPMIKELIARASFARDNITTSVPGSYAIYDSKLMRSSSRKHFMEVEMKPALANGEFFVEYQPKIDLKSEKIIGAEALVRWHSPKLGFLNPDEFIPLFEKNNFIVELDFYVYEKVFKFLRMCLDKNIPVVPISVNMSRNHSKPDAFVRRFSRIFKEYNLSSDLIEIELLERSVMNRSSMEKTTELLHEAGFKVAIDDFGTGESSLSMLTKIPADVLKFDKSFLNSMQKSGKSEVDRKSAAMISSLISLGKRLKVKTLFEGVETEEQRDFLKSTDCDFVQGFFYSKPLEENEFIDFVKKNS